MSEGNDTPFKLDISPEGLVGTITDCLNFSNVFNIAGFETMNDKLLLEMNERAKQQRLEEEQRKMRANKPELKASLSAFAELTKSPPENRFSAAHGKAFASSPSINTITLPKRSGSGEESPSKRRRAPGGAPIGIRSPSKPLESLSLNSNEKLEEISLARQREKQLRDLQTSPRRRLPQRPAQRSPANASHGSPRRLPTRTPDEEQNFAKSPFPKPLFSRPPRATPRTSPVQTPSSSRSLPQTNPFTAIPKLQPQNCSMRAPSSSSSPPKSPPRHAMTSIPRSRSVRGLDTVKPAVQNAPNLLRGEPSEKGRSASAALTNIPSYARPTQAAMRRSQSVNHTLSLRPSSRS